MSTKTHYENDLLLFYNATKIPFCVFDNTPKDLFRHPEITSMECSLQTMLQCCARLKNVDCHIPVLLSSDTCFFVLLRLDTQTNIMFGPISSVPLSYHSFCELNHSIRDNSDMLHLYRVLQQSPQMSLSILAHNICLYLKLAFGETISAQEILSSEISYSIESEQPYPVYPIHATHKVVNQMILLQKKLLPLIQNGDLKALQYTFSHSHILHLLQDTPFSTEELHKLFFSYATLCCAVVLEKGLSTEQILPLFDSYVSRAVSVKTPADLLFLCRQISVDCCTLAVPLLDAPSASEIVNNCLHYIRTHLNLVIHVSDLAVHCGTSSRTITRHFAKYYSMSVNTCILQEKLKEAARLLTHSDMTLSEISNQLAFSSQSHLNVAFKKRYMTTPQQYRIKNRISSSDTSVI